MIKEKQKTVAETILLFNSTEHGLVINNYSPEQLINAFKSKII